MRRERTARLVYGPEAAEQAGCLGSLPPARMPLHGMAGEMLVGEPTSNYPYVGHKGSIKFHATFKGVSAHGSMPHLGSNAIYKAARAVNALEHFDFGAAAHPGMGSPTLNVGTITAGIGVNLVPGTGAPGVALP